MVSENYITLFRRLLWNIYLKKKSFSKFDIEDKSVVSHLLVGALPAIRLFVFNFIFWVWRACIALILLVVCASPAWSRCWNGLFIIYLRACALIITFCPLEYVLHLFWFDPYVIWHATAALLRKEKAN